MPLDPKNDVTLGSLPTGHRVNTEFGVEGVNDTNMI